MPILGLEQTQFISEGYYQHAFNYLGCRKKYPDIGIGNRRFISIGLWHSNKQILFPKATANTRSTNRAAEGNIPILGIEPHSLFAKAIV